MTPFFSEPDRCERLRSVATAWVGTPFHPHARLRGVGCSCQSGAAEIYSEAGFPIPPLPVISLRHFRVTRESAIARHIDTTLASYFRPRASLAPDPGDFIQFEFPDCEHCGIAIGDSQFIHAHIKRGVIISSLSDPTYGQAVRRVWQPIEQP